MANWYIRSGAAGTASGADWTNAKLTLAAAFTAGAAGDSFFVSEDHAETQASAMTLTSPGTAASPCFVYCVNHAGTVPPVSADLRATATITTTGANNLTIGGALFAYGITFSAGSGAASAVLTVNATWSYFKSCVFSKPATNAQLDAITVQTSVGGSARATTWDNTQLTFGNAGDGIVLKTARFLWKNTTSAILGTTPTTLFQSSGNTGVSALIEAVDLSAMGAGKVIIDAIPSAQTYVLKDCKLGASVTVANTPTAPGGAEVSVIRSDSSATNYRCEKYQYMGTQTVETTIVRTGGASDGTTPISWKLVTTANSKWVLPFEALPIEIWNDTAGSAVTVTLYGIWGGGAVPNNDDIWMDVEYLGASANPQGSFISASKADNLAAGSALTTDTSTWGGSTTKFKMSVTFTPQQKGAIRVYVKAATASTTFYIDPKPVLS